jgi:hypothetical protein
MVPSNKSDSSVKITDKLTNMGVTVSEHASGPERKSPKQISAGNAHLFFFKPNGGKLFLGTADDRGKLVRFSNVARDQLVKINVQSGKPKNMGNDREVIIPAVDYDAGRLVVRYINENSIHNPKQLSLALLPAHFPLSFACKVYQACNSFRIPRDLRGNEVREHILSQIRGLRNVNLTEFQSVCETLHFDVGLMRVMCNKVAFHTFKKWISEHELSCIWEYINLPSTAHLGLVGQTEEVWQDVWDRASDEEQCAFREEHGLQIVVVHQSVAGAPLVLSSGSKKPVLKINTGDQSVHNVARMHQRVPSNDDDNLSTTAAVENKVSGNIGAIKVAPSLAQATAAR